MELKTNDEFFEKYQIPFMLKIVNLLGPKLTTLELNATLSKDSSSAQVVKWMTFLEQCQDLPLLNKIKFNTNYSEVDIKQMQKVLIDHKFLPNLTSLDFTNVALAFNEKNDLLSFLLRDNFKAHVPTMTNVTYISL